MGISFKHYANAGDLIGNLAGIKQATKNLNKKAIILQQLNVRAGYYPGAVHPVVYDGYMVNMNRTIFDMLQPLVEHQTYIESMQIYSGQPVVVDLDKIRSECFVNVPFGMLPSWPFFAFPDMATDLSKPWLTARKSKLTKGNIIVNFTERYRNANINYFFLKQHKERVLFVGTEGEHELFCQQWDIEVTHLVINDFLELAEYIKGALFFLGNQSSAWNIANALGCPRILEVCSAAPNCQPFIGPDNYGFYHQGALEYYFKLLINKNEKTRTARKNK